MRVVVAAVVAIAACGGPGEQVPIGQCARDDQCTDPALPYCVDDECHACHGASTCSPDAPRCSAADLTCTGCIGDIDCTGYPDATRCASDGSCVGCVDDAQCSATLPVCDQGTQACRACASDDDCPSAVCETTTGACVAESAVLYVAPLGGPNFACTMTVPCSIDKALSDVDIARTYIKLSGGTYAAPIDATGKVVTIHGIGATLAGGLVANDATKLGVRGAVIASLSTSSTTALPEVTLERVTITSVDARPGKITIRSSKMTPGIGARAIHAQNAAARSSVIAIERSTITGGDGMCILDTSRLEVTNTTIAMLDAGSSLLPCNSFGSVAGPIAIAQSTFYEAPIACADGSIDVQLTNDIFVRATGDAVAGGRCRVDYSIVMPSASALVGTHIQQNVNPLLKSPGTGDFHLTAASPAIDAGDPASAPVPDFDGTVRPIGTAVDLGAFEFEPAP